MGNDDILEWNVRICGAATECMHSAINDDGEDSRIDNGKGTADGGRTA